MILLNLKKCLKLGNTSIKSLYKMTIGKKNRKPSEENSAEAHQMSFLHIGTGNFFDHTIQTAM